jgi:hypothetical protein
LRIGTNGHIRGKIEHDRPRVFPIRTEDLHATQRVLPRGNRITRKRPKHRDPRVFAGTELTGTSASPPSPELINSGGIEPTHHRRGNLGDSDATVPQDHTTGNAEQDLSRIVFISANLDGGFRIYRPPLSRCRVASDNDSNTSAIADL